MKSPLSLPFFCAALSLLAPHSPAQDVFESSRAGWLKKAEESRPELTDTIREPTRIVSIQKDEQAFQGWKAVPIGPVDRLYEGSLKKQSGVILDFGSHLAGYFSFSLRATRSTPDAPVRIKLTFGEVPAEVVVPFDPFPGTLSRGWMQDEVVTVMTLPATVTLPRRLAFRYVKIELLGSSPYFDFAISGIKCRAVSSAAQTPPDLSPSASPLMRSIDRVGLATLKDCMQTVFEDGPKRDQRLWIGDLYLQSLANDASFKNYRLVRRCLYLLAALSDSDGYLPSNVFETPEPHAQSGAHLLDYALLYNLVLKDYLRDTGDRETALDLWPVAKRQLEIARTHVQRNGLFADDGEPVFFDWNPVLDKQASTQGLTILVMNETFDLARTLGKADQVADLPALSSKMALAARDAYFDGGTGMVHSGPKRQVSFSSQVWLILGGVLTEAEGRHALKGLATAKEVVAPVTPYLYHYYVEALLRCGMRKEAREFLLSYWGGMVNRGADSFWEAYDPANDFFSPYGFYLLNSYCHGWSCTPVYFIREFPEAFQN